MKGQILGIDWGTKYVGVAHVKDGSSIVMPVGYLLNDDQLLFSLADIIARYHVHTIVMGYPGNQENIQQKIDKFIKSLSFIIDPLVKITKINEDYSSVESGEIISNFKKNAEEDTVSAMVILNRYLDTKKAD